MRSLPHLYDGYGVTEAPQPTIKNTPKALGVFFY